MTYTELLEQIHELQLREIYPAREVLNRDSLSFLPRKNCRGLYWIWSNLSNADLGHLPTEANTMQIPINQLVNRRAALSNTCPFEDDGFRIVYNGKGGGLPNSQQSLRRRIQEEFNASNPRTGTLNILGRSSADDFIDRWRISFVNFDQPDVQALIQEFSNTADFYTEYSNSIEIDWRIHYGTPMLCRY